MWFWLKEGWCSTHLGMTPTPILFSPLLGIPHPVSFLWVYLQILSLSSHVHSTCKWVCANEHILQSLASWSDSASSHLSATLNPCCSVDSVGMPPLWRGCYPSAWMNSPRYLQGSLSHCPPPMSLFNVFPLLSAQFPAALSIPLPCFDFLFDIYYHLAYHIFLMSLSYDKT